MSGDIYWYKSYIRAIQVRKDNTLVDILCQPLKVGSFSQDIIECGIYKKELVEDYNANL